MLILLRINQFMFAIHQYSITDLQDEVYELVMRGLVSPQQHICELKKHVSDREWHNVEQLFADHDYLLRDRIIDLIGKESWTND
jgi:Domain of unknown function (DUF4327)